MAELIEAPTLVEAAGTPPKRIREVAGRVNTADPRLSIAHMTSPPGWSEPWQQPEFDEWTYVLAGTVIVESGDARLEVRPGQAVHARAGERVRYSTPDGADYLAVCLPAFAPEIVHRDG